MPLRSLVAVVLRLFAIMWAVQAAGLFCGLFISLPECFRHPINFANFLVPILTLVFSAVFWCLAFPLAHLVCRNDQSVLNLGGLTRRDLYAFACVLVGLYLSLSSFGQMITWIHYFLSVAATGSSQSQPWYPLSKCLIDFSAGLALLLFANRWTTLLVHRDEAEEK